MACRIGITTDPDRRQQEWLRDYPSMSNWTLWGPYATKSEAQQVESSQAAISNCEAHPGGSGPMYADWYVYYFEY